MSTTTTWTVLRRSTRIKHEVPLLLTNLDPGHQFSVRCYTLIVNAQGCALRSPQQVPVGTMVRAELANGDSARARSVRCDPLGREWLVALELLDCSVAGNFWRVPNPPPDWPATSAEQRASGAALKKSEQVPAASAEFLEASLELASQIAPSTLPPGNPPSLADKPTAERVPQAWNDQIDKYLEGKFAKYQAQLDDHIRRAAEQFFTELQPRVLEQLEKRQQESLTLIEERIQQARGLETRLAEQLQSLPKAVSAQLQDLGPKWLAAEQQRTLPSTVSAHLDNLGPEWLAKILQESYPQLSQLVASATELAAQRDEHARARREADEFRRCIWDELRLLQEGHQRLTVEMQAVRQGKAELESAVYALQESAERLVGEQAASILQDAGVHIKQEVRTLIRADLDNACQQFKDTTSRAQQHLEQAIVEELQKASSEITERGRQLVAHLEEQFRGQMQPMVDELREQARTTTKLACNELLDVQISAQGQAAKLAAEVKGLQHQAEEALKGQVDRAVDEAARRMAEQLACAENDSRAVSATVQSLLDQLKAESSRSQTLLSSAAERIAQLDSAVTHAGTLLSDQVTRAETDLKKSLSAIRAEHTASVEDLLAREAGVAGRINSLLDALKAEFARSDSLLSSFKEKLPELDSALAQRSAEFQRTVHDLLMQAGGEIRGRVHSALENCEQPLLEKFQKLAEGLHSQAAQAAQAISSQREQAIQEVRGLRDESALALPALVQSSLSEAIEKFKQSSETIAESTIARWQKELAARLEYFAQVLQNPPARA